MRIAFYGDSLTQGVPGVGYVDRIQQHRPQDTLLNYGRFNDTALSLYRRIVDHSLLQPVDIAFLWIGTNDVLVGRSPLFARVRQVWARTPYTFRAHYRLLLDLLTTTAGQLFAVTPALIGESGGDSRDLDETARIIGELAAGYPNVRYLDLRPVFRTALPDGSISGYLAGHALHGVLDALRLRTPDQVDRAAAQRGLYLTLDGIHLNSAGANLVAETFARAIEAYT